MKKYDLIIIGGGPSGYAAAMRAVDFNKTVLVIERNKLGGYGVYDGALASKTMWEFSNKIKTIRDEIEGLECLNVSFKDVKKVISEAIFDRKSNLMCQIQVLHKTKKLIKYEKGEAKFISSNEVEVKKKDGKVRVFYGENILIATGSSPRKLKDVDVDETTVMTSDGIMHMDDFPKSLVIVGAGIIGCEFATMFSNFGKTKVYLVDKADRILPFEDEDISAMVTKSLEKNGVTVHGTSRLKRMINKGDSVEYEVENEDGTTEVIEVEKALLSVGRVPNYKELNLDAAGVNYSENGIVVPSNGTQTNVKHIHAVGDVSGHIALVAVGEREARHAIISMFADFPFEPIKYKIISTIMFLNPEVASVGINEQIAISKNIPVRIAKVDYSTIPRAIAMRKTKGFFKLIVSDDEKMKVLGMRAIGEHASSAIQALSLLVYMGKGIEELSTMVYPHPSIIEGIQTCTRLLLKKAVYKPYTLPGKVSCYRIANGKKTNI